MGSSSMSRIWGPEQRHNHVKRDVGPAWKMTLRSTTALPGPGMPQDTPTPYVNLSDTDNGVTHRIPDGPVRWVRPPLPRPPSLIRIPSYRTRTTLEGSSRGCRHTLPLVVDLSTVVCFLPPKGRLCLTKLHPLRQSALCM